MGDPTEGETIARPLVRSPKDRLSAVYGSDASDGQRRRSRRPQAADGPRPLIERAARSSRTWRIVGLVFVATMALACCLPFSHAVYWLGDEGILLRGGGEMLSGKKLYTDFFEFYPPGGLLITQGWLFVFGQSFAAARALAIASIVAGACFAYLACAVASESVLLPAALVAVWLVMSQGQWTMVDHHWFTTCFSMLAAWMSLASLRTDQARLRPSFMAGLASGAAAMVTPTRGALAILAAVGSLVDFRDRKTQMIACVAGCAVIPILCLAYIVLNGELSAGYNDIIRFPATDYSGIQGVNFGSGLVAKTLPLGLMYPLAPLLPLLVVFKDGLGLLKDRLFRACLLFAIAGFIGIYPRPDLVHISFTAPLALPLLAYCGRRLTRNWNARFVYATGAVGLALCLPAALSYVDDARATWSAPTSQTPAGPISFIGDPDAPALFALIGKTPSTDRFLFYPYMPLAAFIAQRPHVSRYDVFVPQYTPPSQYADACASAEARATWVVLDHTWMDPAHFASMFPAMRNPRPPEVAAFERAIDADFKLVETIGHYEIRKRADPSPLRPCSAMGAAFSPAHRIGYGGWRLSGLVHAMI
jgi:hypothetical protein